MHSCDITILLEKLYFTTGNNLTKNLCVASVSSYSISSTFENPKKGKKCQKTSILGQIPISQTLQYFWAGCFHISETQRCSNKRKDNWLDCKWFFTFLAKYRAEKPVNEPNPLWSSANPYSHNSISGGPQSTHVAITTLCVLRLPKKPPKPPGGPQSTPEVIDHSTICGISIPQRPQKASLVVLSLPLKPQQYPRGLQPTL